MSAIISPCGTRNHYITVHSFNPVGAENMVALLRNAGYVVRRVTPQEMYNE